MMRREVGNWNGVKVYADDALENQKCIVLDGGFRELIDLRVRGNQVQMTLRIHDDRIRVFEVANAAADAAPGDGS